MIPPAPRAHLALLLLAGLAAYHNSFAGVFVDDDFTSIVRNPHVRRLWPLWEAVAAPLETTSSGRPLVGLSVAMNYALGGLEPFGYHAVNLAIHLVAALALYGLVRRTLLAPALRERWAADATPVALGTALLWAVHPLHTGAVTFIIQRAESMMGCCFLLTLYASCRSNESSAPARWRTLAVLACAAGMLSKEVMVGAPLLAAAHDRIFFFSDRRAAWTAKGRLHLALGATWILLAACVAFQGRPESAGFGPELPSSWEYLRTQGGVIAHYLRMCFWPHPLIFHYEWPVARTAGAILPGAALVLALLGATALAFARRPPAGFLGAWFFVILAPSSSVVPIYHIAAERRMYLPLAAVACAVVLTARRALAPRTQAALLTAAALVLALLTVARNEDYRTRYPLERRDLAWPPASASAWNAHGAWLARNGRLEEAISCYRKAEELRPVSRTTHVNLASAWIKLGRLEEAEDSVQRALLVDPLHPDVHYRLGVIRLRQGRLREARESFESALRADPFEAGSELGIGMIDEVEGKPAEARERYRRSAAIPWDGREAARARLERLGR